MKRQKNDERQNNDERGKNLCHSTISISNISSRNSSARSENYNLADSSVNAPARDLLSGENPGPLRSFRCTILKSTAPPCCERIAALYPDASANNVLVAVGAARTNWMVASTLLQPEGTRSSWSRPATARYGHGAQPGLPRQGSAASSGEPLAPGPGELERLATQKTRLISIVNPNNPTAAFSPRKRCGASSKLCRRTGAWLHADEVYRGTELAGRSPELLGHVYRATASTASPRPMGSPG